MHQEKHTIQITPDERELILAHAQLPPGLVARLRFALHTGSMLEFDLTLEDLAIFADALADGLNSMTRKADVLRIQELYVRLSTYLEGEFSEESLEDKFDEAALLSSLPEEIQDELRSVLSSTEFASLDEAFAGVQEVMLKHNQKPQDVLLGLTAEQGFRLIDSDWTTPDAPLQLNEAIPAEELTGSVYCQAARKFLSLIDESGGLALTPKKNLNRKSVDTLLDAEIWPGLDREKLMAYRKALNEEDVLPVNILHILLREARLARHVKGKLVATKLGRQMSAEDQAGKLQCLMFSTMFQKFNLAYLDSAPEYHGVQATVPFILYALRKLAAEPVALAKLADKAFLPEVAAEFMQTPYFRHDDFVMLNRILRPLGDFGLIELIEMPKDPESKRNLSPARLLPLFGRMLRFEF